MSKEVKRYEHFGDYCGPQCGIEESERGCWVKSEDYDAVLAERDGESESCEQWRALALQFDRHRMSALAHLKMVVAGKEGALDACRNFLAAPPVPGHEITAEIDQLRAEVEALMKWKQTAEYWHGQYRLVKHGESPAEYPTEGKLDDWHNSYHNT